jgi:phage terminase small subunit
MVTVMALTEKQTRFYQEYLVDSNATQAAKRAGYSERTAYSQGQRLLKNVEGQNYMKELMAEKEATLIADQDEVLKYLTSVLRCKSQSEIVVVENIGDFISEARRIQKAPDEKERLKAAELLGKRYNLFSDKMKVDVAMPVVISGGEDLAD